MNFGCSEFSFSRPTLVCMEPLHPRLPFHQRHTDLKDDKALQISRAFFSFFCRLGNINTSTGAELSSLSSSGMLFTLSFSIWPSADGHLMGVYWLYDILWLVFFEVFTTRPSTNDEKFRKVTLDFYTEFHCIHSEDPLGRPCKLLY